MRVTHHASWVPQFSGVDARLSSVLIVSPTVVWAGGDNGLLVITEDGGATWRSASLGRSVSLQSLQASDARTAWLAFNGVSYNTLDGGLSWRTAARPEGNFYSEIVQTSPTQLWTAAPDTNQGVVAMQRSVDGGKTWQTVALPPASVPTLSRYINSYKFADALRGLVVLTENGYVGPNFNYVNRYVSLSTQDGGVTWQTMNPRSSVAAGNQPNFRTTPDGSTFSISANYELTVELSSDAGKSWVAMPLPKNTSFYSQDFTPRSGTQAVVSTYDGRYFVTSNTGQSWVEAGSVTKQGLTKNSNSVWFFNNREGMVLTSDGNSLSTANGGQSWTPRNPTSLPGFGYGYGYGYGYGWRKLQFSNDASVGWALSDSGEVFRSTDKGVNWLSPVPQSSSQLGATRDFHFIDNDRGWALVYNAGAQGANLFTSSNGGMSWKVVPGVDNLSEMRSLRFSDATRGVAVGLAGTAMVTSDGGSSWQPRPTGSARGLNHLAFIDSRTVVAVGESGTIVRSTDAGQSWARVLSPSANTLMTVRFVNAKLGHAVGELGTVLMTQDGGLTWLDVSARTGATLQGSYFLDEFTGWVVGDNGTILVTVAGGR